MTDHLVYLAPTPSVDRLATVPRLHPGRIHRPEQAVAVAGGKGLNAARAAATLGGRPHVLTLLGGRAGAWIAQQLAHEGISYDCLWHDGETRECLSVYDQTAGTLTEFYERGPHLPVALWQTYERAVEVFLGRGPTLLTVSGSLPPGAPVAGYASICASARRSGVRVLLDAQGPPLNLALESRPWLVKVNREEAREATGISIADPAEAHAAAAEIRKLGAANAVVTLGATGGVIASEHGAWTLRQQAPPGPFAVGAGDTMLGAIAVRLAQGSSLQEAARYGTAAAAANALTPGAAQFKPAETDRLLARISLEPA